VKYGLIDDPARLEAIRERAGEIRARSQAVLAELVAWSAGTKARIVAADERESGIRAHLNYGHTFAHAIEQASGFAGARHGEAVALGMMCAAYLGAELGLIGEAEIAVHREVLAAVGLPTTASLDIDALEPAWLHDKKYAKGVRFVLLEALGRPKAGVQAPRAAIARALERMR
jgi:3-dehydroquinate synthetase